MSHPEIRIATEEDLPDLDRLFGRPTLLGKCLQRQREGKGILLVVIESELIGHLYIRLEKAEEEELVKHLPNTPLLQHFVVREAHRNRGFGTALITSAMHLLRESGYAKVALGVGLDNHDAVRLYERLRFTEWELSPVETVKLKYGPQGITTPERELCRIFVKNLGVL